MARTAISSRPWRSLTALMLIIAAIYGTVAAGVIWSDAKWTPNLALDLEGGTQIVLTPVLAEGDSGQITTDTLTEAVNVIRQRVDGSGVAEAEVTTQGDRNIVVAIPGRNPDQDTIELVQAAAQLQFRAVLVAQPTQVTPQPTATTTGSPSPSPSGSPSPAGTPSESAGVASPTASASPSATQSGNGKNVPPVLRRPLVAAASPSPSPTAVSPAPSGSPSPAPSPTDASDLTWVDQQLADAFQAEDCTDLSKFQGRNPDPDKPYVTCSDDGAEKFILGPAEVIGTNIDTASAGIGTNSQGFSTGEWEVNLEFDSTGTEQFSDVTTRLAAIPQTDARNRFGIVLDGVVISAPTTNERIPGGQARISGNFTQDSAKALASQLKFGALPISFRTESIEQISATLGAEQLRNGLVAGLIGLVLVVFYSLLQYRALASVTVASLVVVGIITYGLILLLSWRQGYRLSLPGVAGLIVAIGVTADSFIVYFERIKDEVRDGKPLSVAVETAWERARRTIVVSDSVSLLGAVVLFVLAVGAVRGFAFTLGLTTIVDLLVVFLFTKAVVTLIARTRFFGGGHKLSGFDAEHLGRTVAYAGRGRVRPAAERKARAGAGQTIAERRAAQAAGTGGPAGQELDAVPDSRQDSGAVTPSGRGGRDA